MARIVALEWSRHEARFVIARVAGRTLVIERAVGVKLGADEAGPNNVHDESVGRLLAGAFAAVGLKRARALVALGRGAAEILDLTVPPCSNAELADLVANLAMREAAGVTPESIIDFVVSPTGGGEQRSVPAACLSSAQLNRVQSLCAAAGIKAGRIGLRAYGSAALYAQHVRSAGTTDEPVLLISILDDEADLTIVADDAAAFSRTVRLHATTRTEEEYARLLTEISRTLMVADDGKTKETPVHTVVLFGREDEHGPLVEMLREKLNVTVRCVDPFAIAGTGREPVDGEAGRFAPLVGMLLEDAHRVKPAVDFLAPRKRSPSPSQKRLLTAAGGVAAIGILAIGFTAYKDVADANRYLAELKGENKQLQDTLNRAAKKQQLVDAVDEWQSSNIVWLDELRDLSVRFPSRRDAVILRMSAAPGRDGRGSVTFDCVARNSEIVAKMEQNLRDEFHTVKTSTVQQRDPKSERGWQFQTSLAVTPRDKESYLNDLAAFSNNRKPAPAASAGAGENNERVADKANAN